jgi:hypothetical protein
MRTQFSQVILVSTMLLGAAAAQAQPAGLADVDDVLTSTEDWSDADADDDGTLSHAELNRAEPRLAPRFREIDTDRDQRISRDEIAAWQAGPEPSDIDADELPAGEVDHGDTDAADSAAAASSEGTAARKRDDEVSTPNRRTDDLLPDDGDKASELLPDDASKDTAGERETDEDTKTEGDATPRQ